MTWTQEELNHVTALIATGEQSVQYEDRKVVYRGMQELLELKARMQAAIASKPLGGGMRITYGAHSKGL